LLIGEAGTASQKEEKNDEKTMKTRKGREVEERKWLFSPNRIDSRMAAMAEEQRRQPPRMSQMMMMRRSTIIMGTGHRHPKMSIENSAMTPCFPPHFLLLLID